MLPQAINQGSSVDSIFVHAGFTKELAYVVLSRVRTHKGLYLRHPDFDLRRYAVPPRLKEMLLSLENRHCMPPTLKMKTIR
jgi:hypothetical protein